MEKQVFVGKTKEEAIENALTALNANEEEVIIIEKETKKGLFSKKVEIEVITKENVNKAIKDYILFLVKGMGLEANIETKRRNDSLIFNVISSSNSIIIGKNGRTIDAMQNLTSAMVQQNIKDRYKFIIDVNDYTYLQ